VPSPISDFAFDAVYWIDANKVQHFTSLQGDGDHGGRLPDPQWEHGECSNCVLNITCGGAGFFSCECDSEDGAERIQVCFDNYGVAIGFPDAKVAKVDLKVLVQTIGAKLVPQGEWIVVRLKKNRRVAGYATSPSGARYFVVLEVEGKLAKPKIVKQHIYQRQVSLVMAKVAADAVQ